MNRLSSISLIFPAYNEELNIEKAVEAAHRALSKHAEKYEIIVVNDGSADKTGEIIDRLARENQNVVAVHHPKNRGYGGALTSGFRQAKHDFVFFSDSDLQFDLEEIGKLVEWSNDYEIVAGYRANRSDPWNRKLNAWGWNMVVRTVLGVRARDIDCAFKLFQRKVFDSINLTTAGAMINTEILWHAAKNGYRIKEIPVSHYPRVAGQQTGANLKVILRAFAELYRMKTRSLSADSAVPSKSVEATDNATEVPANKPYQEGVAKDHVVP